MLSADAVFKEANNYDFDAVRDYLESGGEKDVYDVCGNSLLSALLSGYYTRVFDNDPEEIRFYAEHDNDDAFFTHVFRYCRMPLEDRPHPIGKQIEYLLEKGISLNAVSWEEAEKKQKFAPCVETPLMHAVEHRDLCMAEFLLKNGADPAQKLFSDGKYDRIGYEDWLVEHMDVLIMNGDKGDSRMLDLEITSLLMHYGPEQWEGGMCIEVDRENRRIKARGLIMDH